MPMRVLHVAQPVSGGVGTVVAGLAAYQVSKGHEVHLASPSPPDLAHPSAVRWHSWEAIRAVTAELPWEARRLLHIFDDIDPDVVHLHSSKAGLCGRMVIQRRCVTVFQPHGWSFLAVNGPQKGLAQAWERYAARWAHALLCVSHDEIVMGMQAGVRHDNYVHQPNAVWADAVWRDSLTPPTPAEARRELGVPPDRPMALCVARLSPEKGVDQLLEAWRMVQEKCPDARLDVVGDGPLRAPLAQRAASNTNITFHGERFDVARWYLAADLVVLPSRYEAMALTPLEAMACGRSVVGFDVPGFAESLGAAVSPSPVQPQGDIAALAKAITRRLQDPGLLAQEGHRNRLQAQQNHGAAAAGDRILRLYEALLLDFGSTRRGTW